LQVAGRAAVFIRQAAGQLPEYQANYRAAYPIVTAPFITDSTADLLSSKKMACFYLAGNAPIDYGFIFIRVGGKTRRNPGSGNEIAVQSPEFQDSQGLAVQFHNDSGCCMIYRRKRT
jgi:hypothetical protein